MDRPSSIGDGQFARPDVLDPAGIRGLGPTVGDDPEASDLVPFPMAR